ASPRARRPRLGQGAIAFAAIAAAFFGLNHWMAAQYPHAVGVLAGTPVNAPHAVASPLHPIWPLAMVLPALALSWYVIGARGVLPVLLLAGSLVLQVSRLDHVALLLIVAALVLARRHGAPAARPGPLSAARLAIYFAVCALLAAGQIAYLLAHHAGTPAQVLGLLLGWPSVRPIMTMAWYSGAAALLAAGGLAAGLWRLAHRERVPDHVLFLTLGVWIPLLQIGCFSWDVPPRYDEAQILPLLLAAFAAAQWAWARARARMPWPGALPPRMASGTARLFSALAAAALCVLVIGPTRLHAAVDPTYASYPDHKGAAEFVRSLHPAPADIIVAEDDLMQTYYLGHVDYWLQDRATAAPFLRKQGGRWV